MSDRDLEAVAAVLWRAEKDAQPHSIAYAETYDAEPSEYRRIVRAQAAALLPLIREREAAACERALREAAEDAPDRHDDSATQEDR